MTATFEQQTYQVRPGLPQPEHRDNAFELLEDLLVCPLCRCSAPLTDTEEFVECVCGTMYTKQEGTLALRSIDATANGDRSQTEDKYADTGFVSTFIARQYGGLLDYEEDAPGRSDRFRGRPAEVNAGCELFYQSLITLATPHLNTGSIVLDVGCGTGRLTGELARRTRLCVGLDYSPLMIHAAKSIIFRGDAEDIIVEVPFSMLINRRARLRGWGLRNCALMIGDCQTLPFRDKSFDVISCANLLHRIPSPKEALSEIGRVIKPGGVLVVSNSYDWDAKFTPESLWFDDLADEIDRQAWRLENELDNVPYVTPIYQRKTVTKFNHLQSFRKIV